MAPRAKQMTPKQLEEEFNKWTSSEEYKLREQIIKEYSKFDELLEITPDFVDKFQALLNLVSKIPSTFRIKKTGIKTIHQEQMRTAFFGGVQQRDEPFTIDDTYLDFQNKDVPKNCRHVKKTFIHLLNIMIDENLVSTNFLSWRKDKLIYRFKEFGKYFKEHSKKGHQETKALMLTALDPFINLMKANLKLVVFELNVSNPEVFLKNFFKYRANIIEFCRSYQPCQSILFT
jgi:hypothetical protein